TRDEGFYYRNFGVELGERREQRRGALEWRLFVERQYSAGDTDVVNTFSVGGLFGDRKFRTNIQSELSSFTGLAATWQQAYGSNPMGLRFNTTFRGEMATGTRQYAKASLEGVLTRPIGRLVASVSGSGGYSAGVVPAQRLWYMGGLKSVRGQIAGTQDGDAFWLTRAEVGLRNGFFRPVAFFDAGAAGSRKKFGDASVQRGVGFGVSILDGLFRIDFSRGLFPYKRWRTDLYLEGPI
ncbi:MAG: BamA/TamA family outer membrane protein, partial [Gemmatimonadaceae bacterium]